MLRAREDAGAALSEVTEEKRSALVVRLFDAAIAYATGSIAEAVGVADLDGDGRSDIVAVTGSSGNPANDHMLDVFIQDTDGTLKPRVQYPNRRTHRRMRWMSVTSTATAAPTWW